MKWLLITKVLFGFNFFVLKYVVKSYILHFQLKTSFIKLVKCPAFSTAVI